MKRRTIALTVAAATLAAAGCAGMKAGDDGAAFKKMMQSSFTDKGIAKVDRLVQDEGQAACSSDKPPTEAVARRIEAQALASMQWPAGGNYLGDWKAGEKLAQSGKGMTWSDKTVDPETNGGNCYNCHQITNAEISYGTIGPSLWNYGKLRGVKNLNDPAAAPVIQYTWGKIWNSKAYAACSNMPRFGDHKLLNQDQIRDLMALLLDPNSPVNQ